MTRYSCFQGGQRPLHIAAALNQRDLVGALINARADLHLVDDVSVAEF